MHKLLALAGLLCDLVGAIVLAASLLGLERIEQLRNRLGKRPAEGVVRAISRLDQERAKEVPHTVGPPGCVLFILSIVISLPLLVIFLCIFLADRRLLGVRPPLSFLHAYALTGLVALFISVRTDGWRNSRKELLPITLGWPVFGVLPPLALGRLVFERLLALLLQQWIKLADRVSSLREDRFVGLLGLCFIVIGFLVQAIGVLMAE